MKNKIFKIGILFAVLLIGLSSVALSSVPENIAAEDFTSFEPEVASGAILNTLPPFPSSPTTTVELEWDANISPSTLPTFEDLLPQSFVIPETTPTTTTTTVAPAPQGSGGDASWQQGYLDYGGRNLDAFIYTILPCESGNESSPHQAVGATDDHGRAQINRPTWQGTFESRFGVAFNPNIYDPYLNGAMAAIVEQEHATGLSAWTCWRNR